MNPTILVMGATGRVGGAVVEQLAAAGVPLRVLVRHLAQPSVLAAPGIELAQGDYTRPGDVAAALDGIEQLFLLTVPDPEQFEHERVIIDAARAGGLSRVVKLSVIGASTDSSLTLGRAHARAEDYLAASGLDYTILRPHTFMQNLLGNAGTISSQGIFYGAARAGKVGAVDVRDIAAVAVAALNQDGHSGKTYVITGPASISFPDMAATLATVLGTSVSYVDVPVADLVESLKSSGIPDFLAKDLGALNAIYATNATDFVTDVVATVANKAPISFVQFARDHAEAFRTAGQRKAQIEPSITAPTARST